MINYELTESYSLISVVSTNIPLVNCTNIYKFNFRLVYILGRKIRFYKPDCCT